MPPAAVLPPLQTDRAVPPFKGKEAVVFDGPVGQRRHQKQIEPIKRKEDHFPCLPSLRRVQHHPSLLPSVEISRPAAGGGNVQAIAALLCAGGLLPIQVAVGQPIDNIRSTFRFIPIPKHIPGPRLQTSFETLNKCWRPFDGHHYDLARKMANYWTNFAKTGDPNGPDQDGTPMPEWKTYSREEPNQMLFYDEVEATDELSEQTACLLDINRYLIHDAEGRQANLDLSYSPTVGNGKYGKAHP